jgi:anti-sigma-K factor RskA
MPGYRETGAAFRQGIQTKREGIDTFAMTTEPTGAPKAAGMTCEDLRELLPALALGALTAEERAAALAHLSGCPGCQAEHRDYAHVVLGLGTSVAQPRPRPELKQDLMSKIAHQARPPEPAWRVQLRRLFKQTPRLARVALAALVLVLVAALTLSQPAVQNQITAWRVASASDTTAQLSGVGASKAVATLKYRGEDRIAVLNANGLPALPAGKTYILWMTHRNGKIEEGARFDANAGASMLVSAPRHMRYYKAFSVSIEDINTAAQGPTGPIVLSS